MDRGTPAGVVLGRGPAEPYTQADGNQPWSLELMSTLASAPAIPFSAVLETPAAPPEQARQHFLAKLSVETDPSDVKADLDRGAKGFVVIDARSRADYDRAHVPGALSIPYRTISPQTTAALDPNDLIVVYCWSPACNAAAKAGARFAALGFKVKEMIGGIEYWKKEGYPVEPSPAA